MRTPSNCRTAIAALLLAAAGAALAADNGRPAGSTLIYGLTGDASLEQSLLASRWASPALSLRFDTAAGLGGAHELRILSTGTVARLGQREPSLLGSDSFGGWNVDPVRATYRYTLLAEPNWSMKLGLSTNLRDARFGLRPTLASVESMQFGSLPLLHVAGSSQWSPRWRLAFALDGLMTGRGRALDLGVQVNYLWSPSMSLYGGYQVTEAAGEAEGYYGAGLNNRANIGLRYRF